MDCLSLFLIQAETIIGNICIYREKKMKKNLLIVTSLLLYSMIYSQSNDFTQHMKKAKDYESQKKWCFALAEYYDALSTDDSIEIKDSAYEAFNNLSNAIKNGNPGFGIFNEFSVHDEWKKLLVDAEKYGSTHPKYELWIEPLQKTELDYKTKTATYSAKVFPTVSYKWLSVIGTIIEGYKKAYRKDWSDLPKASNEEFNAYSNWPRESVSFENNNKYDINGVLVYKGPKNKSDWREVVYYNAFEYVNIDYSENRVTESLHDYKFNIIDKDGNEIVKGKRWLLGTDINTISFSEISTDIMELIENGNARINPVSEFLEYGIYNRNDDKGGRAFIKNLQEKEIQIDKNFIHYGDDSNPDYAKLYFINKNLTFTNYNSISLMASDSNVSKNLPEIVMGGCQDDKYRYCKFTTNYTSVINNVVFLNRMNQVMGLKPVFSIKDTKKMYIISDYRDCLCKYWYHDNFEKENVAINKDANGFRFFTKAEFDLISKDSTGKIYLLLEEVEKRLETDWSYEDSWLLGGLTGFYNKDMDFLDKGSVPESGYFFIVRELQGYDGRQIEKIAEEQRIADKKIEEEKEKAEADKVFKTSINEQLEALYMSISYMQAKSIKNKLIEKSFYDDMLTAIRDSYIQDSGLCDLYYKDPEKFYIIMKYIQCNAVSNYEKLESVYFIHGHTMNEFYLDEFKFYVDNFDKVEMNLNANGYRIPTEAEIKVAKRSDTLADTNRTIIRNAN